MIQRQKHGRHILGCACRLHIKQAHTEPERRNPMKALKNDNTIYTQNIVSAIHDCYEQNNEPTNTELMKLYSFVGQCICEQGE